MKEELSSSEMSVLTMVRKMFWPEEVREQKFAADRNVSSFVTC
jgi:hypothetical protein